MIKVMIVDDEFIVRQDLKDLIDWEKQGCVIAAEATNGREGIEKYLRFSPDIVIADIKMPIMGGLEMANEILKQNENVKFIFLTAYDSFNYARDAIKLGAKSYVLKHELDAAILTAELVEIKKTIQKDVNTERLKRSRTFRRLIKDHLYPLEIQTLIRMNNLPLKSGKSILLIFEMDSLQEDALFDANEAAVPDSLSFTESMGDILESVFENIVFDIEEARCAAALLLPEIHSITKLKEIVFSLCSKVQSMVKEEFKRAVTVGISDVVDDCSEISGFYKQAQKLMKLKMFYKEESILLLHINKPASEKQMEMARNAVDSFKGYFARGEFSSAKEELKSLFTGLLVEAKSNELLKECADSILQVIHNKLSSDHVEPLQKYAGIGRLYDDFNRWGNVFQIYRWISGLIDAVAGWSGQRYSRNIREAIKYLQRNYHRDITLEEIADIMGVSAIYASQLFKKEVGEPFKAYLTNYRIEKAKEFLESGKYKIYEVSEMVGYQTVQYFCQTFKRVTGKNPSEV